jgi:hypothetical protein
MEFVSSLKENVQIFIFSSDILDSEATFQNHCIFWTGSDEPLKHYAPTHIQEG